MTAACLTIATAIAPAHAATYTVAAGSTNSAAPVDLSLAANYTTGVAPGTNDVALISTATVSTGANYFTFSQPPSVGQVRVDLSTGSVAGGSETITSANTLVLNGTGALGASTGGILLNSGAGAALTISANLQLGATQYFTNSRTLNVNGNIDLNGKTLYVDSAQSTGVGQTTFAGNIADSSGSTTTGLDLYAGAGTLTLTGSNTYGGGTILAVAATGGGAVRVGNANALGTGGITFAGNFTLGTAAGGLATTLANPIAINSTFNATVDGANADLTLTGAITGTGNLLKTSAGNVILAAANTYAGETNVSAGVLTVTTSNATLGGTAGLTTPVGNIVFGGTANNGTLAYASAANLGVAGQVRFSNIAGAFGTGGDLLYAGSTAQTVTQTLYCDSNVGIRLDSNSSTGSVTYNGTFTETNRPLYLGGSGTGGNTIATAFTGTNTVTKTGAGKWTLSAANTYTGVSNVSAGTLLVSGSTAAGSAVTIGAAGTLAGTGTVGGAVAVVGTITAGSGATTTDAIGTLTTGVETWSGGTYAAKLDGTNAAVSTGPGTSGGSDLLMLSGLSTSGSAPYLTVNPVGITNGTGSSSFASGASYSFLIAEIPAANAPSGAFEAVVNSVAIVPTAASPAGTGYSLSAATDPAGDDELFLNFTSAAPEPTSLLLAGLAAAPLTLGRRRRSPLAG